MFLIVLFIFGFPAYMFFSKGDVLGGLGCLAVIFVAYVMHLGAQRSLEAWNNRENFWAYGDTDWMRRRYRVRRRTQTYYRSGSHMRRVTVDESYIAREPWIGCPMCGVRMDVSDRRYMTEGRRELSVYRCPDCMKLYVRDE